MPRFHALATSLMCAVFAVFAAVSSIGSAAAESSESTPFYNHSQFLGVKTVTVALVQLESSDVGNWSVVNALVAQAKARGAQFVIFPESSYLGWLNPSAFELATPIPGTVTSILANIAAQNGVWIAFGLAERGTQVSPTVFLPYDAGVLISPAGEIVLHSRKFNVLKNAYNPQKCPPPAVNPSGGCNYEASPVSALTVAQTPLGTTAVLVCADAYTYDTAALDRVKSLGATTIIVVWGVAAAQIDQCGATGFNAVLYAKEAALYTGSMVIGANAVGARTYGRFLPSVYCGYSGIVAGDGTIIGQTMGNSGVFLFQVPFAAGS